MENIDKNYGSVEDASDLEEQDIYQLNHIQVDLMYDNVHLYDVIVDELLELDPGKML